MRLKVPHTTNESIGGGYTFYNHIKKGFTITPHDFYDILFIANPMTCTREDIAEAKDSGKPIVLRLDNIPLDSRNRGTAISRLREFIACADKIIYQSQWSRVRYLEFGAPDGEVIYNGVDTDLFKPGKKREKLLAYVRYSRSENKRLDEAIEMYRRYHYKHQDSTLWIIGRYSDDSLRYHFDFYNGEDAMYCGVLDHEALAGSLAEVSVGLVPYYADSCPNTVLEMMACGVVPVYNEYGGTQEIVGDFGIAISGSDPVELIESAEGIDREKMRKHIENYFNLEKMLRNYKNVFEVL